MKEHKIAEPVLAIPCWGIYADYDANAPDTATFFWVATKELAEEVCGLLNKSPRAWNQSFVDGWEHAKSWSCRTELVRAASRIRVSLEDAMANDDFFEDCEANWGEGWLKEYLDGKIDEDYEYPGEGDEAGGGDDGIPDTVRRIGDPTLPEDVAAYDEIYAWMKARPSDVYVSMGVGPNHDGLAVHHKKVDSEKFSLAEMVAHSQSWAGCLKILKAKGLIS